MYTNCHRLDIYCVVIQPRNRIFIGLVDYVSFHQIYCEDVSKQVNSFQ